MPKPRVVITMNGGLIQDAYSTNPDVELIVVDLDTEDCDPKVIELVEVADAQGGSNCAFVGVQTLRPFEELSGTDTQAALAKAGLTHGSG